jgi:hypothetical protein
MKNKKSVDCLGLLENGFVRVRKQESTILSAIRYLALSSFVLGVLQTTTQASILAYEGFNGYSSGQLSGQTVSTNSVGLSGTITGAGSSTIYTYSSTGLTFSNMSVSGGSALYSSNSGLGAALGFNYSGSNYTGTLYTSYLVQFSTAVNSASTTNMRVNTSASSGASTAYFQSLADNASGTVVGNGYGSTVSGSTYTLATNTTYLVIGIFTNTGTALSTSNKGIGKTYVLTASQYDWFNANGGLSDAALAAASVGTGNDTVTAYATSTVNTGTYSLLTSSGIQMALGNAATTETATFDELRLGSTLSDVIAIPEPSSVALFGLALFGLSLIPRLSRKSRLSL